jgi:hypothetical protein
MVSSWLTASTHRNRTYIVIESDFDGGRGSSQRR